jgi:hypothetical protein
MRASVTRESALIYGQHLLRDIRGEHIRIIRAPSRLLNDTRATHYRIAPVSDREIVGVNLDAPNNHMRGNPVKHLTRRDNVQAVTEGDQITLDFLPLTLRP